MNSKWKLSVLATISGILFAAFILLEDGGKWRSDHIFMMILMLIILPAALGRLATEVLLRKTWATRMAISLSVITLFFAYLGVADRSFSTKSDLLVPMVPWVLFWSVIWIVKGFQNDGGGATKSVSKNEFLPKKKSQSELDDLIFAMYGNPPPPKTAKLSEAIKIAERDLLQGVVPASELMVTGIELDDSPIPYTTNELAFSIAMNFFKKPELKEQLMMSQLGAVLKLGEWVRDKKFNVNLAKSYQAVLYKTFKNV